MTTTESPNYEIDNPVTFLDYITDKFSTPIVHAIRDWNIQEAKEQAEEKKRLVDQELALANEQAENHAKNIISVTIE